MYGLSACPIKKVYIIGGVNQNEGFDLDRGMESCIVRLFGVLVFEVVHMSTNNILQEGTQKYKSLGDAVP